MSERDDELLRGLRDAWRALDAPRAEDADDVPRDAGTRAAVEWARAAWDALEVPPAPALPRRRRLRIVRPLLALAAALVLVWLGLTLAPRSDDVRVGTPPFIADSRVPVERGPDSNHGPNRGAGPDPEAVEPRDPTPVRHATPIRPLLHEDGSIEMRSGKVRLILVPDPPAGARQR